MKWLGVGAPLRARLSLLAQTLRAGLVRMRGLSLLARTLRAELVRTRGVGFAARTLRAGWFACGEGGRR